MGQHVCNGAMLQCPLAVPPGMASLVVLPIKRVMVGKQPAANIMDHVPLVNIPTFGMCMSLANPTVATATSAAMGVLTPMPCIPVIPAPWAPGAPTVIVGGMPALDNTSKAMCTWGGAITITVPGQFTVQVP
ncbi:MAG TPA: DUF4280 domain-containing protein [Chloroflexota bacterium]|nr:DUF4280 domain-containing protein [Chloroflexota bacterium]